jgi:hypothetical protein
MTAFFIPELAPGGANAEDVYDDIRQVAQARTGFEPQEDRIFKLYSRREGVDCEAEVGKPDPICGHTVLAILDMGRRFPYLVQCGCDGAPTTQVIVDKPVYSVTEFTATASA